MKGGSFLIQSQTKRERGKNMKEKNFYEEIKDWDFSMFEVIAEKLTNWDMYEILSSVTDKDSKILDLGTGGGEKLIKHFPAVKEILATDYSAAMIATANKNLQFSNRQNITFRVMDNLKMDTPKDYFDVVVARNTVTDPKQIYATLKNGGRLLIHGVDKYDCHSLKLLFGKGQNDLAKKPISIIDYENVLQAGFKEVELIPLYEKSYFKNKANLMAFLKKVPILDDLTDDELQTDFYKKNLDEAKIEEYINDNTYPQGILLQRRYYGISAKK